MSDQVALGAVDHAARTRYTIVPGADRLTNVANKQLFLLMGFSSFTLWVFILVALGIYFDDCIRWSGRILEDRI